MKTYGYLSLVQMAIRNAGAPSHSRACPRCNSAVFSVSRHFIDLCMSIVIPVRRYRCISMKCSWEGRLRENKNRVADPIRLASSQESVRNPASVRIRQAAVRQGRNAESMRFASSPGNFAGGVQLGE